MNGSELRRLYLEEGNHDLRCAACFIPEFQTHHYRFPGGLQMAHIIARGRCGDNGNVLGNVLFLCSHCHTNQHTGSWKGEKPLGFRMRCDVTEAMLMVFKEELGELEVDLLAELSGWTIGYVDGMIKRCRKIPEELQLERNRWKLPPP